MQLFFEIYGLCFTYETNQLFESQESYAIFLKDHEVSVFFHERGAEFWLISGNLPFEISVEEFEDRTRCIQRPQVVTQQNNPGKNKLSSRSPLLQGPYDQLFLAMFDKPT